MFQTTFHAEDALRLANERLDGLRAEGHRNRLTARAGGAGRVHRLRARLSNAAVALREVEVAPLPRLVEYPYRP